MTNQITIHFRDGRVENGSGYSLCDLFPTYNSQLDRSIEYMDIRVNDETMIRVTGTFLMENEDGFWHCEVADSSGNNFRGWNGIIYRGDIVYLAGTKTHLKSTHRYVAVQEFRKQMIARWREEVGR